MKTLNHLKSEFVRAAMLLGMMLTATTAWAQVTSQTVTYIDQDGKTQSVEAVALDGTETDIGNGWYFIDSDVTFSGDLTYKADEEINLILCDGATLKANRIEPDNSINSGIIRFYGQSQGTGEAIINENIYGLYSVTICGGNITARNIDSEQGSISIYGGTVNASVIEAYYSMYIYGGNVNATDNINSGGGNLELTGGTVTANSIKTTRADSYKPDIILKGSVVKANSYYAKRHITIGEGKTYYDESGTSYAAGDLTADQINAIAGKTLRPYKFLNGGTCGDPSVNEGKDVKWLWGDMDGDDNFETLIITGIGAMKDYDYSNYDDAPWFVNSSNIKTVVIEEGLTSIGVSAFYWCVELTSVAIPSSVTSIGDYSFSSCFKLTSVTIPSSVTSIGDYAFKDCTSLASVTIPSSVTSIGDCAFKSCSALETITVDKNNTMYDSRGGCNAIIETDSKTLITGCMNTVIPDGVTSIGASAFYYCNGLSSISIPSSVMSIGETAFFCCFRLTSITIPTNVTSIGEKAFYDCIDLTSITIPSSVTCIGKDAFLGCGNVTDVYCYADPDRLTWNDNNCNDFIYSGKTTVCHVAGSKRETFETKYSDVNVIFVSDGIETGGVAYIPFTDGSGNKKPLGDEAQVYAVTGYNLTAGQVYLKPIEGNVIPKGMPVVIGNKTEGNPLPAAIFLVGADAQTTTVEGLLKGFVACDGSKKVQDYLDESFGEGVSASDYIPYLLKGGTFKAVLVNADDVIKQDICLLFIPKWDVLVGNSAGTTNAARSIGIGEGGETTRISPIENGELRIKSSAGAWYDLQGRRIEKPTRKGLYIRNGKVVVKY